MPLPQWSSNGLLAPGRHKANEADLYERCVLDAHHRDRREELYRALRTFMDATRRCIGPSVLWIDGGFVTNKPTPPQGVDVVIWPQNWEEVQALTGRDAERVYGLMTLQDVLIGQPLYVGLPHLQPFAGELDAFLGYPGQDEYWDSMWSRVKGPGGAIVGGLAKGYVEVTV